MTTPRTPAGWYPDPDGSGGQRYWDGSGWTEHRSPASRAPADSTAPAEPPDTEQPTTVVPRRPPVEEPTTVVPRQPPAERVGAHRAPEPGPTSVINLGSAVPSEQTTSVIRTSPPAEPSFAGAPVEPPPFGEQPPISEPTAQDPRRQLIIRFGAVCAALLAVLAVVLIYALFIHKDNTVQVSAGPSSTTKSAAPTTTTTPGNGGGGTGTETATESPTTASGSDPQGTDAGLTFAVTGVETAPSVTSQDAPVEQTAQGEYLIVHLTVSNSGDQPGTFVGTFQKLKAGGITYSIDDVATAYLKGTVAQLNPGDTSDVAIAFDVPPGTTPESLEAHGDPVGAGVDVPLS
jgi:Domain of unknown function (DUF4352)/Protein of unknown function (DUF2510)